MSPKRLLSISLASGIAAFLALGAIMSAADPAYKTEVWGQIPQGIDLVDGSWGDVAGMSMDLKGNVIIGRRAEPPLIQLDPSGKVIKSWGKGMFIAPHGMRVDREGFIWVTDAPYRAEDKGATKGHQVFKFSPDGSKVVMTLGTAGVTGETPTTFNQPSDVAFAKNGDIFVVDGHGGESNARIVKFSKDGKFIKAWGSKGSGPGQFSSPHAIALDSRDRVFVADRSNKRIQIFDSEGKFLEQWTKPILNPSGLFMAPDDTLYVADNEVGLILYDAKTGATKAVIQQPEMLPESIVVNPNGRIYTGESGRHRSKNPLKLTIRQDT